MKRSRLLQNVKAKFQSTASFNVISRKTHYFKQYKPRGKCGNAPNLMFSIKSAHILTNKYTVLSEKSGFSSVSQASSVFPVEQTNSFVGFLDSVPTGKCHRNLFVGKLILFARGCSQFKE